MEYVIAKGKYYDVLGQGGLLTYDPKKGEYTCYVDRKKHWTEKSDAGLFNYVSSKMDEFGDLVELLDRNEMLKFPIYRRYEETVQ